MPRRYKPALPASSQFPLTEPKEGQDITEQTLESPLRFRGDLLTQEDRKRLARNILGYDISPDMVRLSLVNLYLHGFPDPKVEEYDTLTSEGKWTEMADVILANPPFMSPKGGIKPHTKFQVQSKRSEVLFVDYMAEHLTPNGRAAIVVPEGIIFQSQSAYVALRKMLVENHLAAVISLPAGVFNPYSGVKTSILILDRAVAKASQHLAFFKIENDGFALGAQRKAVKGSQLGHVTAELGAWLQAARAGGGEGLESALGSAVERARIAEGGDYNLSGERYREAVVVASAFPMTPLAEVCEILGGATPSKQEPRYWSGADAKWISCRNIGDDHEVKGFEYISDAAVRETSTRIAPKGSTIIVSRVSVGKWARANDHFAINQDLTALVPDSERLSPGFLHVLAPHIAKVVDKNAEGIGVRGVTRKFLQGLEIPLPPLEVQREIVAEVEGYQRVIDGARAVIDNYRPNIPVDPEWPVVAMGDVCTSITDGDHQPPPKADEGIPFVTISNLDETEGVKFEKTFFVPHQYFAALKETRRPVAGDLLYSVTGSYGVVVPVDGSREFCFQRHIALLRPSAKLTSGYLLHFLRSPAGKKQGDKAATGVAQKTVSLKALRQFQVPLPPIDVQRDIIAEIETEQGLVNGNRDLITRFEEKIDAAIARVWGEASESVEAA